MKHKTSILKNTSAFLLFVYSVTSLPANVWAGGPLLTPEQQQQLQNQISLQESNERLSSGTPRGGALVQESSLAESNPLSIEEPIPNVTKSIPLQINGAGIEVARVRTTTNGILILSGVNIKNAPAGSYVEFEAFSGTNSRSKQTYDPARGTTNLTFSAHGLWRNYPSSFKISVKQRDAEGNIIELSSIRSGDLKNVNANLTLNSKSLVISANQDMVADDLGNLNIPAITVKNSNGQKVSLTVEVYERTASGELIFAAAQTKSTNPVTETAGFSFKGLKQEATYFLIIRAATKLSSAEYHTEPFTMPAAPPPLVMATSTTLNGRQGQSFTLPIQVTGGTGPYTFSIQNGALPEGLSLSSAGVISGTPTTQAAGVSVSILVRSANNQTLITPFTFNIGAPRLVVSGATLVNFSGAAGGPITIPLSASGGVGPYTWSVLTGTLPSGLTLSPEGVISGTPNEVVTNRIVTFQVRSADNQVALKRLNFNLQAAAPLTVQPITNGLQIPYGQPFEYQLQASGGIAPYRWTIAGTGGATTQIVEGVHISADGRISGTALNTHVGFGPLNISFEVRSDDGQVSTVNTTYRVYAAPLTVPAATMPAGQINESFHFQLPQPTGGVPPYTYSLHMNSAMIPTGFMISSTGLVSGSSSTPIQRDLVIRTRSADGQFVDKTYTLNLQAPPIVITETTPPDAKVGESYSFELQATGGYALPTWSIVSGTLPQGLNLSGRWITGTPRVAGPVSIVVQAVSSGRTATREINFNVESATLSVNADIPPARVTHNYSHQLVGQGGVGAYQYILDSANQNILSNAGLSLSNTGLIEGVPTQHGEFSFTVTVRDNAGNETPVTLTVTIEPEYLRIYFPQIYHQPIVGEPYELQLTPHGGVGPFIWSLSVGQQEALEAKGLTFANGLISGTPTSTGSIPLNIDLEDSRGVVASMPFTVVIDEITGYMLPQGQVDVDYSASIVEPGEENYIFSFAQSTLNATYGVPPRDGYTLFANQLNLSNDGTLSGTPGMALNRVELLVNMRETQYGPVVRSKTIVLDILPREFVIPDQTFPNATLNRPYNHGIQFTGGHQPVAFTVLSGADSLAALNLSFSGSGITGTPNKPGSVDITVQAEDARGTILTKRIQFDVLRTDQFRILAPAEIRLERGTRTLPLGGDPTKILEIDFEGGHGQVMYWLDGLSLENGDDLEKEYGIGSYHFSGMHNTYLNIHQKPTLFTSMFDADRNPFLPNAGTIEFYINAFDGHQTIRQKMTIIIEDPNNDGQGASISLPSIEPLNSRNNAFTFSTGEPAKVWFKYGTSLTNLDHETKRSTFQTNHKVVLDGLRPETDYYYQVFSVDTSGNITQSQIRQFRTNDVEVPEYVAPFPLTAATATVRNDAVTLFLEDQDINITVLSNDSLPANQRYIQIAGQAAHGRVRVNSNGTINYFVNEKVAPGTVDTFSYMVCTGPNTGCATTGQVTVKLQSKPVVPEVVLHPNLYRTWTEPSTGTVFMRVAYEIKNASNAAAPINVWGMVTRAPAPGAGGASYSGGIDLLNPYGEGVPREVRDGVFYTDVALGDFSFCATSMVPCPSSIRVPYDPEFDYTVRVDLRPLNGLTGGTTFTVGTPVYGSLKTGSQSHVRVQLGNENIVLEANNSANLRPEVRCFSTGCPQYGANLISDDYMIPANAFQSGYGTINRTGFTPGAQRAITVSLSDYVRYQPSSGGYTSTSNFTFNVNPIAQPQQLSISAPGQINNTGFGATLPITITGVTSGNVTLNIYQSPTSNVVVYTTTVTVGSNGVATFLIPSQSNGMYLYGSDFSYGIVAGALVYPAAGLSRPQIRINAPTVAAPAVAGIGYRVSGQPVLRFTGTIPGYNDSRIVNGTARYQAYIMITNQAGETTLHAVPVDANNNIGSYGGGFNISYPTNPDGYSGYQGITARLVVLPLPNTLGWGPFNFTQVQSVLAISQRTAPITMSNLRI